LESQEQSNRSAEDTLRTRRDDSSRAVKATMMNETNPKSMIGGRKAEEEQQS
jgi:hypothetical protein